MDLKIVNDKYKFKVRVAAVIILNNKLLVTKYGDTNMFCLPGGYVEIGETTENAIKREIKEELKFEINVESFLGTIENFFINNRNQRTHGIDFYYKVSPKNILDVALENYTMIEKDKENLIHHRLEWLKLDELNKYSLKPQGIIDIISNQKFSTIFHIIEKNEV